MHVEATTTLLSANRSVYGHAGLRRRLTDVAPREIGPFPFAGRTNRIIRVRSQCLGGGPFSKDYKRLAYKTHIYRIRTRIGRFPPTCVRRSLFGRIKSSIMMDSKRRNRSPTRYALHGLYGTRRRRYCQARRSISLGFILVVLRIFFNPFQRENVGHYTLGYKRIIFFLCKYSIFPGGIHSNGRHLPVRSSGRTPVLGISFVTSATVSMVFFFSFRNPIRFNVYTDRLQILEINDVRSVVTGL